LGLILLRKINAKEPPSQWRGFAVSRPIFGMLASFAGIYWVFHLASAVSLLTWYPASKYKKRSQAAALQDKDLEICIYPMDG
jgi:hypothetical protein